MGSLFSPKTPSVPPPQPVEYVNTRDEVGGTQSTYVTNPDGTKTLVTTKLPLTPEQQAVQDKYDQVAKDSLDYIEKLSTNFSTSDIPWLDQYIKDYETTQVTGLDKATADSNQQQEQVLARNGQADSTAAIKARGQSAYNYTQQRQQITRDLSSISEQARQTALGNATNLFSLATGRQDALMAQLQDSLARGQNFQLADAANQNNYNAALYNANLQNATLKQQSRSSSLSSLSALAALSAYGLSKTGGFSALGKKLGWA